MHRPFVSLVVVTLGLLTACGPGGFDTTGGPGSSSSSSSSTTSETTPTSTGATEPTSAGSSTSGGEETSEGGTTVEPGTTQPVDTTGLATTSVETTGLETTSFETTGTTADGGTSTGDTDDIPDTTGGELCGPGAEEVDIDWKLEVPPALVGVDIEAACKIVQAVEMEPDVAVTMSCDVLGETQQVVLHYKLVPYRHFEWLKNETMQLDYHTEQMPFAREWLKLSGYPTIFRGVHADTLTPPGVMVETFYDQKIKIEAPCDPQPDACGQRQGLQLRFLHWVEGMMYWLPIRSGETLSFGFPVPVFIWLEHASRLLEPIGCADVAPRWFDLMVIDDASGA